jgi:integrase
MPRPRPPHLHREVSRHGRANWYVRLSRGPRIRLRAEFNTDAFWTEYHAAVMRSPPSDVRPAASGRSVKWLIDEYKAKSPVWPNLSKATRKQRDCIFQQVIDAAGDEPYSRLTKEKITEGRDRRSATPFQARHFLDALRGLFRWAKEIGHVTLDPTAEIRNLPRNRKGGGFLAWREEFVEAYRKRWPLGTRQRVWLEVVLATGLRRSDAVRLGRQHTKNGCFTIHTVKSGDQIEVMLPILPALAEAIKAGPVGDMSYIVGARKKPMTKETFGNEFRDACVAAGLPGRAHGLRKLAARIAAENGVTGLELDAMFGWVLGSTMSKIYTDSADRKRLSTNGAAKLMNDERTNAARTSGEGAGASAKKRLRSVV